LNLVSHFDAYQCLNYEPGDHVGVCPANRVELVNGILDKLTGVTNPDEISQLQILNEKHTSNGKQNCFSIAFDSFLFSFIIVQTGISRTWDSHEKIPTCSLRTLLTRFMDITSSPSRQFLTFLSGCCEDDDDKERMEILATESDAYEDWRHNKMPHLLAVFDEFPSCKPPAALFVAHLTALQPRFYSISSSQKRYPNEVHLTVAIVQYETTGECDSDFVELNHHVAAKSTPRARILNFSTFDYRWKGEQTFRCMLELFGRSSTE
jgi:nitric-oxide synthase, brain